MKNHFLLYSLATLLVSMPPILTQGQSLSSVSKVWISDQGDGTYKNPILHADYSDPDVVRVGDSYYLVASSFNCIPGIPVLHSRDLVNWTLIGHALNRLEPEDILNKPQHGKGVWAPCIRYHNNEFYIYYPDPDYGIFLVKAMNPAGPWSKPLLVARGKGLIDPSPLWDDDGNAYLVFAFAGSRAGIKSVLMVDRMTSEGTRLSGKPVMVFEGSKNHPTIEGPKFYKRNGWYYIFAPAGGVKTGWQLVLRSKNIFGPYEEKTVMAQGKSTVNGPHQGGWVNTPTGEYWFIHFQDKEAYGRVVHLNPMKWINDWPVIGDDSDGDGCGEPVSIWKKPNVGRIYPVNTPPENDEFNSPSLGLQWQWHANPGITYGFPSGNLGFLRLNCIPRPEETRGLWQIPNLILQKFPAEDFIVTAKYTFHHHFDGEEVGFVVMGTDYQYVSLKRIDGKLMISSVRCIGANKGSQEEILFSQEYGSGDIYVRLKVEPGALCTFSFSSDGMTFSEAGPVFQARPGVWIGAKFGFFALREGFINDAGTVDLDWIRIEAP
jgi:beta-xylosidase